MLSILLDSDCGVNVTHRVPSLRPPSGWVAWRSFNHQKSALRSVSEPILAKPELYSADGAGKQGRWTMVIEDLDHNLYDQNPVTLFKEYD